MIHLISGQISPLGASIIYALAEHVKGAALTIWGWDGDLRQYLAAAALHPSARPNRW